MNYLSRYGWDYLSPVGQDSQDIISTDPRLYPQPEVRADRNANALEQYMPQGLVDFGQSVKAAQGKPTLFGKALGALGLDAEGRRAATSWSDAAKATMWLPGEMVHGIENAVAYPYQAATSTTPISTGEMVGPALDIATAAPMGAAGAHAAGVKVAPREIVAANSKDAALPGLLRSAQAGEQLPMDTASRMKRAQEMGFDTGRPLYHGTFQDFDAFDANAPRAFRRKENNSPQVHTTTSATEAEKYGDKIMPLYARGRFVDIESPMKMQDNVISRLKQIEEKIDRDFYKKSQIELDGGEPNYRYNYDTLDRIRKYLYGAEITDNFGDSIAHARMKAEISKAKRAGADGVRIRGGWGDEGAGEHYVVFDPKNLRSQFAAFDPAKKDSPNLLASNPKESAFLSALAGEQMQQPGITAYHGSPHSFDKFSMDKIGTGEGAQAYGHGLYMAENEAVARQYRDALSDVTVNGKEPDWKNPDHWMATALHTAKGDRSAAISEIARNLESQFPDNRPAMRKAIADLESGNVPNNLPAVTGGGHMYEVRINADPEHFLDWDKPLSQQSEKVQGALSKFDRDMYHPEGPDYDPMEPGHIAYQRLAERLSKSIPADADAGWSSVVNTINDKVQNRGSATDFLRDNGVPGIRYLDQGSRTAGEGSRNFVVFDDKLISIVRKYGWAGAAAMLGMSTDDLMSQAQAQQSPGVPASNPLYR